MDERKVITVKMHGVLKLKKIKKVEQLIGVANKTNKQNKLYEDNNNHRNRKILNGEHNNKLN